MVLPYAHRRSRVYSSQTGVGEDEAQTLDLQRATHAGRDSAAKVAASRFKHDVRQHHVSCPTVHARRPGLFLLSRTGTFKEQRVSKLPAGSSKSLHTASPMSSEATATLLPLIINSGLDQRNQRYVVNAARVSKDRLYLLLRGLALDISL